MLKKCLFFLLLPVVLRAQAVDVHRPPTLYEMQQISYVVNTLANTSGPGLLFKKGNLQQAGQQTSQVHPLRWMEVSLTDPKLKTQMKRLRKKQMVWNPFSHDMGASFERQWQAGTFNEEEIDAYAAAIGVNSEELRKAAGQRNWRKFIEISIDQS